MVVRRSCCRGSDCRADSPVFICQKMDAIWRNLLRRSLLRRRRDGFIRVCRRPRRRGRLVGCYSRGREKDTEYNESSSAFCTFVRERGGSHRKGCTAAVASIYNSTIHPPAALLARSVRKRQKNIGARSLARRFQHSGHCVFRFFSIEFRAAVTTDVDCDMGWEWREREREELEIGSHMLSLLRRQKSKHVENECKEKEERRLSQFVSSRESRPTSIDTLPPIPG